MKKLEGQLLQFNYSPKGGYEGLLLETKDGIVQINFAHEHAPNLVASIKPSAALIIKGEPWNDDRPGDHPVFELVEIKVNGKAIKIDSTATVSGTVVKLNYAKHGVVNGAVLDTGDFVHLRPHGADAVSLMLGQKLSAKGEAKPKQFGAGTVIEAHTANGIDLDHHKAAKKAQKAAKKAAKTKAAK